MLCLHICLFSCKILTVALSSLNIRNLKIDSAVNEIMTGANLSPPQRKRSFHITAVSKLASTGDTTEDSEEECLGTSPDGANAAVGVIIPSRFIKVKVPYNRGRWHCEEGYGDQSLQSPSDEDGGRKLSSISEQSSSNAASPNPEKHSTLPPPAIHIISSDALPEYLNSLLQPATGYVAPQGSPTSATPAAKFAENQDTEAAVQQALNAASSSSSLNDKITLAMDLVKSHLSYAVRQEVSQHDKRITELEAENVRLKLENQFLRSRADPETLAQLAAQQRK